MQSIQDIEFRGLTLDGKWKFGDLIRRGSRNGGKYHYIYSEGIELEDEGKEFLIKPETIGQFIGLYVKDIEEQLVKLFTGDIVKIFLSGREIIGIIEYEQQACAYWIKWKRGDVNRYYELKANGGGNIYINDNITKIGNIHQNKEIITWAN